MNMSERTNMKSRIIDLRARPVCCQACAGGRDELSVLIDRGAPQLMSCSLTA